MTDRELLELAAKAAGINTKRSLQYADGAYDWPEKAGRWNPLADDGDAFRLAVKLGMTVSLEPPTETDAACVIVADWSNDTGWPRVSLSEPHKKDSYAATRRAIVRAAAEIGASL
jgi:hypothetical protein